MKVVISSKGQIVIPAEYRNQDKIEPGRAFDIERVQRGEYRLVAASPDNQGLVNILLGCPVKGWFAPIESESTDTLGSHS